MDERADLDEWFQQEVLPLESSLTRFLRRNWNNESDLADFRQELYANVYEAAHEMGTHTLSLKGQKGADR